MDENVNWFEDAGVFTTSDKRGDAMIRSNQEDLKKDRERRFTYFQDHPEMGIDNG